MNVVIIEDEHLAAEVLEDLIKEARPDISIMATIGSVEEGVEWFASNPAPDLVFSDIHLSDGSSFDLFSEIKPNWPIIFTTAYNQYAIDAFKVNSVDYLLKPVSPESVAQALNKFDEARKAYQPEELTNLRELLQNYQSSPRTYKNRFLVKTGTASRVVQLQEIAYFQAEEGVVFLVTFQKKRFIVNFTLDQLEEQLDPQQFYRVNRQFLISINSVHEVRPYFKGRLHLLVEPQASEDLIVSSGRASSFKDWLDS